MSTYNAIEMKVVNWQEIMAYINHTGLDVLDTAQIDDIPTSDYIYATQEQAIPVKCIRRNILKTIALKGCFALFQNKYGFESQCLKKGKYQYSCDYHHFHNALLFIGKETYRAIGIIEDMTLRRIDGTICCRSLKIQIRNNSGSVIALDPALLLRLIRKYPPLEEVAPPVKKQPWWRKFYRSKG